MYTFYTNAICFFLTHMPLTGLLGYMHLTLLVTVYTCSYPFSVVLGRIVGELVTNVTSLSVVTHILWGGWSHSITEVAWCGRFPHLCCQSICLL